MGTARNMTNLAAFLLSDLSNKVTKQAISTDGDYAITRQQG